jgi:hypothetical protein
MASRLKNPLTIHDPYTRQGLSYQATFRPNKSGATVPLKYNGKSWEFIIKQDIIYGLLTIAVMYINSIIVQSAFLS